MSRAADFQIYDIFFPAIAPAAIANQAFQFDASADFIWYYAAFSAYNHAANTGWTESSRLIPPITVLMTPGDTAATIMNIATPITHFFGSGEMPFVLPAPRLLPARSTMAFQVTNLDTTITYDLYLSLIGVKRYLSQ